jgi:hypothetical protein
MKISDFINNYGDAIGGVLLLIVIVAVIVGVVMGTRREGFSNDSFDSRIIDYIRGQKEENYADYAQFLRNSLSLKELAKLDTKYTDLDYYKQMFNNRMK